MEKIIIIGCGGFGREVKMLIDQINEKDNKYEIYGFYDDNINQNPTINGIPFRGKIENANNIDFACNAVIAIGSSSTRKKVYNKINNENLKFPNLIHPKVTIGTDDVYIGKGNIICCGVIITVNIIIEDFIILNLNTTVGHDSKISSFSSVMPNVNISGQATIDSCVYIGSGVQIINKTYIGKNSTIGAGALVSKNIESNCTVVGVPAKPIKFHD